MAILAIDTTGAACAVALRQDGSEDLVRSELIGRGHAERLAPMVEEVLGLAGIEPAVLTRIGVLVGPGSFAGSRVGVAFARGLALSTEGQAFGISNLDLWAAEAGPERPLAVIHDAKRDEAIVQIHAEDGNRSAARRLSVAELGDHLRSVVEAGGRVCGSGADLVDPDAVLADPGRAESLAVLLNLVASAPLDAPPPSPFYARPPDAKLPTR